MNQKPLPAVSCGKGGTVMDIFETLTAFVLALSFLLLLWAVKGLLLRPARAGRHGRLTVLIRAAADVRSLEREISALRWLREDGLLKADILIVDMGMDDETALIARALSRDDCSVRICAPEQIINYIIRGSTDGGKG